MLDDFDRKYFICLLDKGADKNMQMFAKYLCNNKTRKLASGIVEQSTPDDNFEHNI